MARHLWTIVGRTAAVGALAACLACGWPGAAQAQGNWWLDITYGASIPSGDTRDFAEGLSWRNLAVDARRVLGDRFAVGVSVGWSVFAASHDTAVTVAVEGAAITGAPLTYVNAVPLLATAHYYFGNPPIGSYMGVTAFVGVGLGAYLIENRADIGSAEFSETNWHPGVAPEAGIGYKMGTVAALLLSVRYNYAFKSGGFTHNFWNFNVGLAWGG
jgi:hypothetical protein